MYMDIKRLLHLPRSQPVLEGDPTQGLPRREFEITNTRTDSVAARIMDLSSAALTGTGVETEVMDQLTTESSRRVEQETDTHEWETADLTSHILGDKHLRDIMKERVGHQTSLRRRQSPKVA